MGKALLIIVKSEITVVLAKRQFVQVVGSHLYTTELITSMNGMLNGDQYI
jgi:hypothetical protein